MVGMENKGITLSEFQQALGAAVNANPATRNVWVRAEFSDLRVVGGHCYMELIEKDASGRTVAKIRAMIWAGTLGTIRFKFKEATGKDLMSGLKVLVKGSATHHALYGLSFVIADIDPSYTMGDLERQRQEILAQLAREGVAGINRNLPLPVAPQRIAVISAAGAAGYGDFADQLTGNPYGYVFYPMLFPAVMQGERTAPSVIAALDRIESMVDFWDIVVIIRGGGSTSDLNGFDNLELARRVATFPLPVAVGIGHERDRNVLDELACVRCKTPTAVAAWLIDSLHAAYSATTEAVTRISRYAGDALRGEQIRLANFSQTIPALARERIMHARLALTQYAGRVERAGTGGVTKARQLTDRLEQRLRTAAASAIEHERLRLKRFDDMIRLLSPQNTLQRGYSITRVNGKAISDPAAIPADAIIETQLAGGTIKSKPVEE